MSWLGQDRLPYIGFTSSHLPFVPFPLTHLLLIHPISKMAETNNKPSIEVRDLSYKFQDGSDGLENVTLDLPAGSRTLLIGGNRHIVR